MATITAASFLEPNPLKWTHTHHPTTTIKLFPAKSLKLVSPFKSTAKFHVKCLFSSNPKLTAKPEPENSNPSPINTVLKALKAMAKPAVAAVLLGLVLMSDPNIALAASDGRVGGKSFSSRSSSSSSRSYSVPSQSGRDFSYSTPYYAPTPTLTAELHVKPTSTAAKPERRRRFQWVRLEK